MTDAVTRGVLVTGMHRSGTSMTMALLAGAGLNIGRSDELIDAADDNPDGFGEHRALVRLADDLLTDLGGAWDLPPTPATGLHDPRIPSERVEEAQALISRLATCPTWGWKDPRAAFLTRWWDEVAPGLSFIICVRDPLEVALSLKRRNRASYALAVDLWRRTYRALIDSVPGERRLVVHYAAQLDRPEEESERICRFSGLDPRRADPNRFDPELRHHRTQIDGSTAGLDDDTIALYRQLCAEAGYEPNTSTRAGTSVVGTRIDVERLRRRAELAERHATSLRARLDDTTGAVQQRTENALARRLDSVERALRGLLTADLADRGEDWNRIVELLGEHLAEHDEIAVIAKGDPAVSLLGRPAGDFPQDSDGRYLGFSLATGCASIAHLEALVARGVAGLVIPRAADWWWEAFPDFGEHLRGRYVVVEFDAGWLVDLRRARPLPDAVELGTSGSLRTAVTVAAASDEDAVLDWTDCGVDQLLRDLSVFSPIAAGDSLPYLDDTVPIVVIDDPRRATEAHRVAARATITIDPITHAVTDVLDHTGDAAAVDDEPNRTDGADGTDRPIGVLVTGDAAYEWGPVVLARLGLEPDDVAELPLTDGGDVVVVDAGVVPLPGALAAARRMLDARPEADAIAGKIYTATGAIESAGVLVFADGTSDAVAADSYDDGAGWHEYVREVAWGTGMLVYRASALVGLDIADTTRLEHLAASRWRAGARVVYSPEVMAVRVEAPEPVEQTHVGVRSTVVRPSAPGPEAWRRVLVAAEAYFAEQEAQR